MWCEGSTEETHVCGVGCQQLSLVCGVRVHSRASCVWCEGSTAEPPVCVRGPQRSLVCGVGCQQLSLVCGVRDHSRASCVWCFKIIFSIVDNPQNPRSFLPINEKLAKAPSQQTHRISLSIKVDALKQSVRSWGNSLQDNQH